MARFVMRVWLADCPGALGALTTALGNEGVDLIGIDILEKDGSRVVDELTLAVPDELAPDDLVDSLSLIDQIQIEDVRRVIERLPYPGTDPLDVAVELGSAPTIEGLAKMLAHGVAAVFSSDWAAVLGMEEASGPLGANLRPKLEGDLPELEPYPLAVAGQPPAASWLSAFVSGASSLVPATTSDHLDPDDLRGPRDIAWAVLEHSGASVVVGRGGPPFRSKERFRLTQLCRIADARWRELTVRAGKAAHPSAGRSERTHPAAAS